MAQSLQQQFGAIDIYLFDQLLRGRIRPGMRVFDAGCGHGRNLVYLLQNGYEVYGVDADPDAIAAVRSLAMAAGAPPQNFRVERIEAISAPEASADVVLCNTVLHFAQDDAHFAAMLRGAWRVLRPGGVFFCRLASTIGMEREHDATRVDGRRFVSPDGEERYLVDEAILMQWTVELGGALMDPLKTTVVQSLRCMTTWVLQKM
jgi:tellurite methyltransferase